MTDEDEEFQTIVVYCDDEHPRRGIGQLFRSTIAPTWHLTHMTIGGEGRGRVERMSQNHTLPASGAAERFRIVCTHCAPHGTFTARNDEQLAACLQRLHDGGVREIRLTELHTARRLTNAVR